MRTFLLCDLETTGTNPMNVEMVEAYLALYHEEKMEKELHLYIAPRYWDREAEASVEFHGITQQEALKGLPWKRAMKEIWDFLPDSPAHFVCHANRRMFGRSGCFDWQVLCSHFLDVGFEHYLHFQRVCPAKMLLSTHSLSKHVLKGEKNDLATVAHATNVPLKNHHTAKNDSIATWEIFKKLRRSVDLDWFCEEDFYQLQKIDTTKPVMS